MAFTLLQSTSNSLRQTTATATFGSACTLGSLLIAIVSANTGAAGGTPLGTVSDNGGTTNTWASTPAVNNAGTAVQIWYCANNQNSTALTVSSLTTTGRDANMVLLEYSGQDTTAPLDGSAVSGSGTGTAITTATLTTTGTTDLLVGGCVTNSRVTVTANTPYTIPTGASFSTDATGGAGEHQILTTSVTQGANFTASASTTWAAAFAAFKVAAAGGGGGGTTAKLLSSLGAG